MPLIRAPFAGSTLGDLEMRSLRPPQTGIAGVRRIGRSLAEPD
jgi:hypothetical protein